jgi:D-alanyl-D-alanine carboxypeptidase
MRKPPSASRHLPFLRLLSCSAILIIAVALLLARPVNAASAQAVSPRSLLSALVRDGAPGAVALVRQGDQIHTFAAGLADLKQHRRMRARLRFRMGSLSKPVVATLVLKLVAERRLRLTDTISRWLPGLVPDGGRITVRELLQHRSGLANYISSPELFPSYLTGQRPLSYVWMPRQLVGLATELPLDFPPGTSYEYSNTNYIVLGLIVERVTDIGLERYAERTIFRPLGMRSTSFAVGLVPGPHAHGYLPLGPPFPAVGGGLADAEPLNGSWAWAAGSLVSTAADLERFFQGLFSGRVIPHRLVALMQAGRPIGSDPSPNVHLYGLGLEETRYGSRCGTAWGHTGDVPGYMAGVRASRDARKLVVVLINRDLPSEALLAQLNATLPALYCGQ